LKRGSNLRNEKFPGKLRATFRNQFVVRLSLQPKLRDSGLFLTQKMEVYAQLVAQIREAQIDSRLEHASVRFAKRVVHQLGRKNGRPTLMQIAPGVGIAERS
jgi:hypothetical protein